MENKKLGFWSCTTYVTGNMIGSGIFMLPATLAVFGGISLVSWIIAACGALLLATVFNRLSSYHSAKQGGPFVFTRDELGEFPSFIVAWGYWISIWTTNAALAVAFVSYLTVFIPVLKESHILAAAFALGILWFLTWLNTRPILVSGKLQNVTTILKIIPLLLIAVVGLFYVNTEYFTPFNRTSDSTVTVFMQTVALTLFAFLGLESATIPAHKVENAKKIIPLATLTGTCISVVIYVASSIAVMGIIPPETLAKSNAPLADTATVLWGENAARWVTMGALISTFGALNGWLLMQGQIPAAAAREGVFPRPFERENKYGMPTKGLIFSSILASVLIVLNFYEGFTEAYTFIILLATITSMVPYVFSAIAFLKLEYRVKTGIKRTLAFVVGLLTLLFCYMAIKGSGVEAMGYGLLLLLTGVPFYIWVKWFYFRK